MAPLYAFCRATFSGLALYNISAVKENLQDFTLKGKIEVRDLLHALGLSYCTVYILTYTRRLVVPRPGARSAGGSHGLYGTIVCSPLVSHGFLSPPPPRDQFLQQNFTQTCQEWRGRSFSSVSIVTARNIGERKKWLSLQAETPLIYSKPLKQTRACSYKMSLSVLKLRPQTRA